MLFSSISSAVDTVAHPFYVLFGWVLAGSFAVVSNYAIAIAILTIIVMLVLFPATLRGTRATMKMRLLAPELKKLQERFKVPPGASLTERQELRRRQQEEMMALYRENGVTPTGGCLPSLLQVPIFLVLYETVRGLVHQAPVRGHLVATPLYVDSSSALFHAVVGAGGKLQSFGINLADSFRSGGLSWPARLPFLVLIVVAIGLQYLQMRQISARNPQTAGANAQLQQMQKVLPIIYAVIYVSIPAAVNIYFIVSSLFRIGQQEFMYRRDPHISEAMKQLQAR